MSRIRTIKPEFWEDEKIGRLPIPCRLFFIGCWNFADDFGCIKGNAALLKSQIFPYDENLRVSEVKKWIDALVDARMLIPIIHAEESYYYIRTFRSHQVIDKRYDKSFIGKEIVNDLINKALREHNVNTTSTHSEHHVNTMEEMEKEKEKEKEQKRDTDVSPESPDPINSVIPENGETHPPVAPPPPPKNPEKPKKAAPDFDMTNIPAEYIPSVQMWLDYKRGRGQTYKTQKSFELMVEQLQCFSRGDPKIAEMIVKQSMANNWAGLFELKNATTNGNSNRKNDEDFARELATVALEVEYEHLDKGRITEDEFRRRTGIEPVSRQYR